MGNWSKLRGEATPISPTSRTSRTSLTSPITLINQRRRRIKRIKSKERISSSNIRTHEEHRLKKLKETLLEKLRRNEISSGEIKTTDAKPTKETHKQCRSNIKTRVNPKTNSKACKCKSLKLVKTNNNQ